MLKKVLYAILILAVSLALIVYFMWNKPHKDIAAAKEDFVISASDFYKEYSANEAASKDKYNDKVIAVEGSVSSVDLENTSEPTVELSSGTEGMSVRCGFKKELLNEIKKLKEGDKIKIKGKCDGLDMFGIVITQCSFIK